MAVGTLIAMSSWKRIPLDFQLMQGSLIAGGVAAGAIAITRIVPWASFLLGIITGKIEISLIHIKKYLAQDNCREGNAAFSDTVVTGQTYIFK